MKRNRIFIIGLMLMLVPFILAVIFYGHVPDQMAINFNFMNQPSSYASKEFTLFGLPLIMLVIYILTYSFLKKSSKKDKQSDKLSGIGLLFIPIISILATSLMISHSLAYQPNIVFWISVGLGILFIILGSYMPRIKINHTVGIRLPWTLASDVIWKKTHRLAAYIWIIGGILLIIGSLCFRPYAHIILIIIILLIVLIPLIYSYILYRQGGNKSDN